MTPEPIQCPACGAKFSAARTRCPRCRAVLAVEDPVADAARSRRLRIAAAGISAAFVLALAVLWFFGTESAPSASRRSPAPGGPGAAAAPPAADDMEPAFVQPPRVSQARPGIGGGEPPAPLADVQQSLTYYEGVVRDRPGDVNARDNLGRAQLQLGRNQEAIASLQVLTDAAPFNPEHWVLLAHAQCLLNRWDECIGSLRKAAELAPDDAAVAHNLGVALHRRGSEAAAITEYQRARSLRPGEPGTHLGLAVSHDRLGQPVEAIAAYQEYLRLLPEAPGADKIRARIATLGEGPGGR